MYSVNLSLDDLKKYYGHLQYKNFNQPTIDPIYL